MVKRKILYDTINHELSVWAWEIYFFKLTLANGITINDSGMQWLNTGYYNQIAPSILCYNSRKVIIKKV